MTRKTPRKPPLEALTKPSVRNPGGKPRCQRNALRDGKWWQCPLAARDGFTVCWKHGAGSAKREGEGRRKHPKTAALVTGENATPETLQLLFASRPEFQALYAQQLASGGDLLDYREELAMAKALARWFVQKAKLEDFDNSGGKTPPALLAIDRLERVVAIGKRCLEIEASLGAISHAELKAFLDVIAETLHRFVPPEREEEAREFMRVRIRAREQVGVSSGHSE